MTIKPVLKPSLKHENKSNDSQDSIQSSGTSGSSSLRPSHRGTSQLQQQKPGTESSSPQRDLLTTSATGHGHSSSTGGHGSRRRRSPNKRIHHKRDPNNRVVLDSNKSCKSPAGYQIGDQIPVSCASPHAGLGSPKSHNQIQSNASLANNNNLGNSKDESNSIQLPEDEALSGYNSGDEHIGNKEASLTLADWANKDKNFAKALEGRGFVLNEIAEDGACLFRSISLQIYGDQDMHEVIRNHTMDYIYKNREYFAQFVTEDITSYVLRKRNNHVHGNHIEIQAISEIYNRPVELYCYQTEPINIFNPDQMQNGYEPLRLSYQRGSHYNAILNPYKASVGVGLGLAGYSPNEPERTQMHEAVRMSEDLEIEQTMFEDKLKTTDWEATNEAIEEQIARESYLQWCRDNMQQSKVSATRTSVSGVGGGTVKHVAATSSNSTVTSSAECLGVAGSLGGGKSPKLLSDEDDTASFGSDTELAKGSSGKLDLSSSESYANYAQQRLERRRKRRRAVATPTAGPSNDINSPNTRTFIEAECSSTGKQSRVSPVPSFAQNQPGTSSGQSTSSPSKSPPSATATTSSNSTSPHKPTVSFYHELLESSFSDDLSDLSQLTEAQMLQKALQMSRMDFMKKQHSRPDSP